MKVELPCVGYITLIWSGATNKLTTTLCLIANKVMSMTKLSTEFLDAVPSNLICH